jgi:hypothetical protein
MLCFASFPSPLASSVQLFFLHVLFFRASMLFFERKKVVSCSWEKCSGLLEYVMIHASLESYELVATEIFPSCMWVACESQLRKSELHVGRNWDSLLSSIYVATEIFSVACWSQLSFFFSCTWVATEIYQIHVDYNLDFSCCGLQLRFFQLHLGRN